MNREVESWTSSTHAAGVQQETVDELKELLSIAAAMPDVINQQRVREHYLFSMMSVGKPWFGYDMDPAEPRLRLRVIERWLARDGGRDLLAGVIKVQLQHVYPGDSIIEASLLETNDQHDTAMVLEQFSVPDQSFTTQATLYTRRNGKTTGLLCRRGKQWPYTKGYHPPMQADMVSFAAVQPDMEADYTLTPANDYDMPRFVAEVAGFLMQERLLAAQRASLRT